MRDSGTAVPGVTVPSVAHAIQLALAELHGAALAMQAGLHVALAEHAFQQEVRLQGPWLEVLLWASEGSQSKSLKCSNFMKK